MRMNAPTPTASPDRRSTKAWNSGSVLAARSVSQRSILVELCKRAVGEVGPHAMLAVLAVGVEQCARVPGHVERLDDAEPALQAALRGTCRGLPAGQRRSDGLAQVVVLRPFAQVTAAVVVPVPSANCSAARRA